MTARTVRDEALRRAEAADQVGGVQFAGRVLRCY
jgi:hypothetical protein